MKKIVIIDDDQAILDALSLVLKQEGYLVRSFDSGKSALRLVAQVKPDLIFLDIWMSGMDGIHISNALRANPKTKEVPIIMISALSDAKKLAKDSLVTDYLAKPFTIEEILLKVEKYCKK